MKMKTYILATASAMSLLACGGIAWAQDAQPAPAAANPTDPAASPADTGADSSAQVVVVTGLRRSAAAARAIKKNSEGIVDAVVAAEIGKLPDTTASDSLARVTGVQVTRAGGEANGVLVRGLPDIATSYNGRDIFTAEGRFVAIQDFAAGNVAALEVYKSATPDMVEGGLAGLINVVGRRPFDFKGREISGQVNYLYTDQAKAYAPNGNLLLSDRWSTSIGEIGALLNISDNRFHYIDSNRFIGSFVSATIDPNLTPTPAAGGARFGDLLGINYAEHDRERPSANAAVQWKPNDELELYADFLYQGYRDKVSDRQLETPLWAGSQYSNIKLSVDGSRVDSMTVTGAFRPQGWQAATTGRTDTYQSAIGGKWRSGPWTVTADLAATQSKFFLSVYSYDFMFASNPIVDMTYNAGADGGQDFTYRNFNQTDPKNIKFRGFFDRQLSARGRDVQFRTDVAYNTNISFLPQAKFGIRYVDRKAGFDNGQRYNNVEGLNLGILDTGLDVHVTQPGFVGLGYPSVRSWAMVTPESIRANVANIRQVVGFAAGPPPYDPGAHFAADEKSTAFYAEANYAFNVGVPVDGVIGVRVVKSDESETSSQRTSTSKYTDTLPSVNMRIHLTDNTQIHLAASKTRTRPNFADLNPNYVVNSGTRVDTDTDGTKYRFGGGSGNINLKPFTAKNFDATLEHYFSSTGIVAVDLFSRDVEGFINYHIIQIQDPTLPDTPNVRISVPYNANPVKFKGAEFQFTTFFDQSYLPSWAHYFGLQANATYMDSHSSDTYKQDKNQPGVSRLSYNLTGMYENGKWSARLAYNGRSKWLNGCDAVQDWGGNPGCEYTKGVTRIDFYAGYKLTDNLSLSLDLNNMLPQPTRVYRVYTNEIKGGSNGIYNTSIRTEESVYSVGIHFHY